MMFISSALFSLFSSLGILCSFFVISSKNTVFSALFLILAFFNFSSLLLLLKLEFLSITFLVIYVGAIAILFVFVIMLLNLKNSKIKENDFEYVFLAFIFSFVFLLEIFFLARLEFVPFITFSKTGLTFLADFVCLASSTSNFSSWHFFAQNARYLGLVLFTEYFYSFIVSGFILLLAMVGVIVLTIHKKFVAKTQNIFAQVLRNHRGAVARYF
jgi:NADH-quinone oxidoreductase subunit J